MYSMHLVDMLRMARLHEHLSDETKAKQSATKAKHFRDACDWSLIDPFLDADFGKSSRRFSARKFKEHIVFGGSAELLAREGVDRCLLQFYTALAHGRVSLLQPEFETLYRSGLSLFEVGQRLGIPRKFMGYVRYFLKVKRTGATYQKRKATEIKPTARQLELIAGSLMGDAKRTSPTSVGFGHGNNQKAFLMWKYSELADISSVDSLKGYPYKDKRSGYEGVKWCFYTKANSWIEAVVSDFYIGGAKDITADVLARLTPLSLAVWYMDDGRTDWWVRPDKAPPTARTPECLFCTESFSFYGCNLIIQWLRDSYAIKARLRERKLKSSVGYRVVIDNQSVSAFLALISPHVIPSMQYKVDREAYLVWRHNKVLKAA
jgi:hypothetical protein